MKAPVFLGLVLVLLMVVASGGTVAADQPPRPARVGSQAALGTAFTYQGVLKQGGSPVNSSCDFQFSLWDAEAAGAQVGSTLAAANVTVSNGLFTVPLDFGAGRFDGQARWLESAVRCPVGAGEFTTLSPRQALTATPYALYAASAGSSTAAATAPWSGLIGVPAAFAGGADDVGWSLSGNGGTSASSILGTTDAVTLTLAVSGTAALRLGPNFESPNVIGGSSSNRVDSDVRGATIGGGGNGLGTLGNGPNAVTGIYGTIGGGLGNTAGVGSFATVGGGQANTASNLRSTVAGGSSNLAQGSASTVAGGRSNRAEASFASVGGGTDNVASGANSTVPGGSGAEASHFGEMAYASGPFVFLGDAQTSLYVLRGTTTGATQTSLFLNGASTPLQRLTVTPDRTVAFEVVVVARSQAGESAGARMRGVIERVGDSTTLLTGATGEFMGQDPIFAASSAQALADDANESLDIRVTGADGATIRWVAVVRTVEVAF